MKLESTIQYINGYRAYKKLANTPIIIGGCERTGTSLLQSIISTHPQSLSVKEETWAFSYGQAAGLTGNKPIRVSRLYTASGSQKIIDGHIRWLEKSPANVFYLDSILNFSSNYVKLIHIVKDDSDIFSSMHPENPLIQWVNMDHWIAAKEEGYRYRNNSQILTIKYEDLITNYNLTIEKVCDHIGTDINSQVLDWHQYVIIKKDKNLIGITINKFLSSVFEHKHNKYHSNF